MNMAWEGFAINWVQVTFYIVGMTAANSVNYWWTFKLNHIIQPSSHLVPAQDRDCESKLEKANFQDWIKVQDRLWGGDAVFLFPMGTGIRTRRVQRIWYERKWTRIERSHLHKCRRGYSPNSEQSLGRDCNFHNDCRQREIKLLARQSLSIA